mmetsp:Transcript_37591/g.66765  ORF Transcript_37591/g.66765 Transcript_37591/m.66765 type:complete len:180 (+) Transcript_37591:65-604(+)
MSRFEQLQANGLTWQEVREMSSEGTAIGTVQEHKSWSASGQEHDFHAPADHSSARSHVCQAAKAPYPRTMPAPQPWLASMLPEDPRMPGAPVQAAAFWGSLGLGLGVLRGVATALVSGEAARGLVPRYRCFLLGFAGSTPWYVTFLALAGCTDCLRARNGTTGPRLMDAANAHGAVELG